LYVFEVDISRLTEIVDEEFVYLFKASSICTMEMTFCCEAFLGVPKIHCTFSVAFLSDAEATADEEPRTGTVSFNETKADIAGGPDEEVQVHLSPRATPVDSAGECVVSASPASVSTSESGAEQSATGGPAVSSCENPSSIGSVFEVAFLLGGMDTGGEIFDDCMIMRLSGVMTA
jgi:hypothetical protein